MGTEYDFSSGSLGTSPLTCAVWNWPDSANAALVLPSGVPVKAVLLFGVKDGIGYFSPEATSLGVLDIGFISEDIAGRKAFHIQFKNVPIPLVEVPPVPVATNGVSSGTNIPPSVAQPQVSLEYFHAQLAPYGTWVEVPGYGQCWCPTKVIAATPDRDWRPYYDNGHWEYTENGWFWVSDYDWGDIPFHYGRWIRAAGYGWLWVPDLTWGPAWVCWRQAEADGYIGWAPLPFGAVWIDGGWRFRGRVVTDVNFDFGLGEDFFVFVGRDHFHEHYFRVPSRRDYAFHVRREVVHGFYGRTVLRNEFHKDEHGRLVNEGLGRKRVEELTRHEVKPARFTERHAEARPDNRRPGPANQSENKIFRPPTTPSRPTPPPRPTPPTKK